MPTFRASANAPITFSGPTVSYNQATGNDTQYQEKVHVETSGLPNTFPPIGGTAPGAPKVVTTVIAAQVGIQQYT